MAQRAVRRGQTITPFGVGAVIDMLGESFVAEDISRWRGRPQIIRAPRIAAHFNTTELQTAATIEDRGFGVPYYRFPQWLFCGSCRQMVRWSFKQEKPGQAPRCDNCASRPQLVPMRFVVACGNGHLDDVEWVRWAHTGGSSRDQSQCGQSKLRFLHVPGVGGGLESLEVTCSVCRSGRNLRDLTGTDALHRIGIPCRGRQPWQRHGEEERCQERPVVLQRGASSVYFPAIGSAIDIPPDSDWTSWGSPAVRIAQNPNFKLLLSTPEHPLADQLVALTAVEVNVSEGQVRAVLADRLGGAGASGAATEIPGDLQVREWRALTSPVAGHDPRDNFISRRVDFPSPKGHGTLHTVAVELAAAVSDVILVDRLREIRVLTGFRRHTMLKTVPVDLSGRAGFLPAVEVFGEGVFIRLDSDAVSDWEHRRDVRDRVAVLARRLERSVYTEWLELSANPRSVLLHTLAHLLIRQMAFDAGYSSSSIRERLYDGEDHDGSGMTGMLLYTAAGDSEGSLGGLARLGEPERLVPMLASALAAAQWCSLDPVCGESTGQGPEGLSLAACHACALASETSCVAGNLLLDRALVVDPVLGFLHAAVAALPATGHEPTV
jgi:hypothetical protein